MVTHPIKITQQYCLLKKDRRPIGVYIILKEILRSIFFIYLLIKNNILKLNLYRISVEMLIFPAMWQHILSSQGAIKRGLTVVRYRHVFVLNISLSEIVRFFRVAQI